MNHEQPPLTPIEEHQVNRRPFGNVDISLLRGDTTQETGLFKPFDDKNPSLIKNWGKDCLEDDFCRQRALLAEAKNIILHEKSAEYDEDFKKQSKKEKKETFYSQIEQSAQMTIRLRQHITDNLEKWQNMEDQQIYSELEKICFDTNNPEIINQTYSLTQRRGFRLAIWNFIHDLKVFQRHKKEITDSPQKWIEQNLSFKLQDKFNIEYLPIGMIIYLSKKDLASFLKNPPENITTNGLFIIKSDNLSTEFNGKIILINKDKPSQNLKNTREHEIQHLIYYNFHEQKEKNISMQDLRKSIDKNQDLKKQLQLFKHQLLETAKNELIAYSCSGDKYIITPKNLFIQKWRSLQKQAEGISDTQTKKQVQNVINKEFASYLEKLKQMQIAIRDMYESVNSQRNTLTEEKITALLANTEPKYIFRVAAKYASDDLPHELGYKYWLNSKETQTSEEYNQTINKIITNSKQREMLLAWIDKITFHLIIKMYIFHSSQAIPGYKQTLEFCPSKTILQETIDIIELLVDSQPDNQDLISLTPYLEKLINNHQNSTEMEATLKQAQRILVKLAKLQNNVTGLDKIDKKG